MSVPESHPVARASADQEPDPHTATVERFADLGRKLSQATVFFHSQAAEHVGLSATDHKCLDLAVQAERPLTAGQIAELSGLSTGAVTGVIDRLERAGFVRRVRDPHDRRKVLVEVSRGSLTRYGDVYEGLWSALDTTLSTYTEGELKAIERYITSSIDLLNSEAERLSSGRGTN
jgi:DNA-binding MarR family transcriptional regulator